MTLNGWQRLGVALTVVQALFVLVIAWSVRPTETDVADHEIRARTDDVSDVAIRAQLTPAENATLSDPSELWVAKVGGELINPYVAPNPESVPALNLSAPNRTALRPSSVPMSVREFAQLVKSKYPEVARFSDDVLVADVLAKYPDYRADVDPRAISEASKRFDEEIAVQRRVATVAQSIAKAALVHEKRIRASWMAFAAWVIPSLLLYGLGWTVGWVRRGFEIERAKRGSAKHAAGDSSEQRDRPGAPPKN